MFRFYSNENLSIELVTALRRLGYDVLTSFEAGNANQGIPDDKVLAAAVADDRCIITFNRDDFVSLHRSNIQHKGIVICKDAPDRYGLACVLHDYLRSQQSLHNRLIRVLKENKLGAPQPIFVVTEYSRSEEAK